MERLDKILSHAGFGTRKDVKRLLHSGVVAVNGQTVYEPDFHVDAGRDAISVDGEMITHEAELYLMMNKPQFYVCANKDGQHETVFSLLEDGYRSPYYESHLHLVGRLDIDTEGLLLFTTDGDLTHRLISPKTHCEKKYFVRLRDSIDAAARLSIEGRIKAGFEIPPEGNEAAFTSLPAKIDFTQKDNEVFLTITEGKYHQVKRMFSALGNEVVFLKRVQVGALELDENLKPGEYKRLTLEEISLLCENR